jgi:hypothetical protein
MLSPGAFEQDRPSGRGQSFGQDGRCSLPGVTNAPASVHLAKRTVLRAGEEPGRSAGDDAVDRVGALRGAAFVLVVDR